MPVIKRPFNPDAWAKGFTGSYAITFAQKKPATSADSTLPEDSPTQTLPTDEQPEQLPQIIHADEQPKLLNETPQPEKQSRGSKFLSHKESFHIAHERFADELADWMADVVRLAVRCAALIAPGLFILYLLYLAEKALRAIF